jgi:hypothetical protein
MIVDFEQDIAVRIPLTAKKIIADAIFADRQFVWCAFMTISSSITKSLKRRRSEMSRPIHTSATI